MGKNGFVEATWVRNGPQSPWNSGWCLGQDPSSPQWDNPLNFCPFLQQTPSTGCRKVGAGPGDPVVTAPAAWWP